MRILWLTAHYPPDFAVSGAALQTQRLAARIASTEHRLLVFSGAIGAGLADGEIKREIVDDVDVCWFGTRGWIEQDDDRNWHNPVATEAVARVIDEFDPDLVHAHMLQTLGHGPVDEALDRGIRTIVTMRDMWWWCARLFLVDREIRPCALIADVGDCACARDESWRAERGRRLRRTLDRVDEILVPSASMRDVAVANGVDPGRVTVDPNDLDVPLAPIERREDPERVRFVYLGGDHPVKGAEVALRAARSLRKLDGWHLTMYGLAGRNDRPPPGATFAPAFARGDLAAVLGDADVLVIPSVMRESYSNVAREALAAGLPVVSTDCIGPEEVVDDGRNGLIVASADPTALADAMRRLVDDRALFARLRDGARATQVDSRDPDEHAGALLRLYEVAPTTRRMSFDGRWLFVCDLPSDDGAAIAAGLALDGADVTAGSVERSAAAAVDADTAVVLDQVGPSTDVIDLIDRARAAGATVAYRALDDPDGPHAWDMMERCDVVVASNPSTADRIADRTGLRTEVITPSASIDLHTSTARSTVERVAHRAVSAVRASLPRRRRVAIAGERRAGEPTSAAITAIVAAVGDAGGDATFIGDPGELGGAAAELLVVPPAPAGRSDVLTVRSWLAAALVRVPVVAAAEGATGLIDDGRTGVLVDSPDGWEPAIARLLADPAERARIGHAAHRQVVLYHGPHVTAHAWRAVIGAARTEETA